MSENVKMLLAQSKVISADVFFCFNVYVPWPCCHVVLPGKHITAATAMLRLKGFQRTQTIFRRIIGDTLMANDVAYMLDGFFGVSGHLRWVYTTVSPELTRIFTLAQADCLYSYLMHLNGALAPVHVELPCSANCSDGRNDRPPPLSTQRRASCFCAQEVWRLGRAQQILGTFFVSTFTLLHLATSSSKVEE